MGETNNQRQSIEDVYRSHAGSLRRFLDRFLDSRVEVEDVLQEAFLKAFEAERKADIELPLPFLFKTAKNLALNTMARYRRQRTDPIADFDDLGVLIDVRQLSNLEPESEALIEQQLALAREVIGRLTPRVREVFVLRKIYGYTHREIAERLGISISTVEKHVAQGIVQMKRHSGMDEAHAAGPLPKNVRRMDRPGGEAGR